MILLYLQICKSIHSVFTVFFRILCRIVININLECEESLYVRLIEKGSKKISEVLVRVQEVRWV